MLRTHDVKRDDELYDNTTLPVTQDVMPVSDVPANESVDDIDHEELKLPKRPSLVIMIVCNILLQMSFFIVVSSSNEYAHHLGGDSTFSGVVIGIPTFISGLSLIPMMRFDKGQYRMPLHVCCAASILGHVLYASAYAANWLYLILIGRMVSGVAFTSFMYTKRYCTDARFVGIRRRTTLASWLTIGQGIGMSAGPFLGGLLYKISFKSTVFNGFTSPGWLMAGVWAIYWVAATIWFEDDPTTRPEELELEPIPMPPSPDSSTSRSMSATVTIVTGRAPGLGTTPSQSPPITSAVRRMTKTQMSVTFSMCWHAMTCFFVLGAWESNIPVFAATAQQFGWSPFAAGNFIALGGIATVPFLLLNLFFARRTQDRNVLILGVGLGAAGLVIFLSLLYANGSASHHGYTSPLGYAGFFMCWFLVALGFNLATTISVSLLSKQLPPEWNGRTSLAIQYSNYTGRVTGAIWGGSGVKVGMSGYVWLEMGIVAVGATMFTILWKNLKAKKG